MVRVCMRLCNGADSFFYIYNLRSEIISYWDTDDAAAARMWCLTARTQNRWITRYRLDAWHRQRHAHWLNRRTLIKKTEHGNDKKWVTSSAIAVTIWLKANNNSVWRHSPQYWRYKDADKETKRKLRRISHCSFVVVWLDGISNGIERMIKAKPL